MLSNEHIPLDYYGKWAKIVEDWRKKSGETTTKTSESNGQLPSKIPSSTSNWDPELQTQADSGSSQGPSHPILQTLEDTAEPTAPSSVQKTLSSVQQPGEDMETTLTRLRGIGMSITPTVITRNSTNVSNKKVHARVQRGGRKASI